LFYQWKRDGQPLPGRTNLILSIPSVQPSDEGHYSVSISNQFGLLETPSMRLWVVPPATRFVRTNFTNDGVRLPYFYLLPTNYSAIRQYPLVCWLHGGGTDENLIIPPRDTNGPPRHYLASAAALKVFASCQRELTAPCILLWPSRRTGDKHWTDDYLQTIPLLLKQLCSEFSVDADRIYLGAASEGVHAAWDIAAAQSNVFAGAVFCCGWQGRAPPSALKSLPVWVFHSTADEVIDVRHSRLFVEALRHSGGQAAYTELATEKHAASILAAVARPELVDWLFAQRRGQPPQESAAERSDRAPGLR